MFKVGVKMLLICCRERMEKNQRRGKHLLKKKRHLLKKRRHVLKKRRHVLKKRTQSL
jgi:hypothetical protein